jgi:hypothetical protein
MKTYNQVSQSAVYREDDISVSITVCGGSYGGGSEVLVVNELSESNRFVNGEQSSRQLLRSGRIQRHVGDRE